MPLPDTIVLNFSPFLTLQTLIYQQQPQQKMLLLPFTHTPTPPRASHFYLSQGHHYSPRGMTAPLLVSTCFQSFPSVAARINVQKGKFDHVSPQLQKHCRGFLLPLGRPKHFGVDYKALLDRSLLASSPDLGAFSCSHSVLQTHRPFFSPSHEPHSRNSHIALLSISPTPVPPSGTSSGRHLLRPKLHSVLLLGPLSAPISPSQNSHHTLT